jgi:hypothetical protein
VWPELIAQGGLTGADGGWSGWVGAGLLGLVLGWLLYKHLPDKDQQITGLISTHHKHLTEIAAQNSAREAAIQTSHMAQVTEDRKFFAGFIERIIAETQKAHVDVLGRLDRQGAVLEALTRAVVENQTGICQAIKTSEEHYEHFALMAQEWRDLTATDRRKFRQSRADRASPPADSGPGGVTT